MKDQLIGVLVIDIFYPGLMLQENWLFAKCLRNFGHQMISITLCSDCLLGYNPLLYVNRLLGYTHLLCANH
jgi:hypothetical protein